MVASEPDTGPSRGRDRWQKPGRRWGHKVLLSAHVLASVGWFGVAVTVALCGIMAGSNDDIAYYEIIQSTLWLTVPLGLTAAVTGVALSLTTRWGLVRHWWVVAKEAITLAAIATDVLVVAPAISRSVDTGTPGVIPEPIYYHVAVLAIATVVSVVKPRARTPLAPRA